MRPVSAFAIACVLLLAAIGFESNGLFFILAVTIWLTLGAAIFFGITDEIHQSFVPFRNCDWHDLIADGLLHREHTPWNRANRTVIQVRDTRIQHPMLKHASTEWH